LKIINNNIDKLLSQYIVYFDPIVTGSNVFKTFEHTEPLKTGYFDGYGLTDSYEKQWKDLVKRIKNRPFPELKEFTKQWRV
jgi:hypothetical protein